MHQDRRAAVSDKAPAIAPPAGSALARLAQALPLLVFLLWMELREPRTPAEWRGPYYASTLVALLVLAAGRARGVAPDRLHLALVPYYLSGSLGLALGWDALNRGYGVLAASGMLAWLLAGALLASLLPGGFVGVDSPRARRASLAVAGVVAVALALSWALRGDELWSAYVPFVAVFAAHGLARRWAQAARARTR